VDIFPNPITTSGKIRIKTKTNQQLKLNVYNAAGQLVHAEMISTIAVTNVFTTVYTATWQSGLYVFVFENNNGERVKLNVIK
jgi:Secretion system C-terminal sorting domain